MLVLSYKLKYFLSYQSYFLNNIANYPRKE